jgi:hypothetical protein
MGPAMQGAAVVPNDWIRCRTSPPGCAESASGPRVRGQDDVERVSP